jgi:hypothetical protein
MVDPSRTSCGPLGTEHPRTIAYAIKGDVEDLGAALFPEMHLLFKAGDLPETLRLPYKAVASGVPKDFEGGLTIRIRRTASAAP